MEEGARTFKDIFEDFEIKPLLVLVASEKTSDTRYMIKPL